MQEPKRYIFRNEFASLVMGEQLPDPNSHPTSTIKVELEVGLERTKDLSFGSRKGELYEHVILREAVFRKTDLENGKYAWRLDVPLILEDNPCAYL